MNLPFLIDKKPNGKLVNRVSFIEGSLNISYYGEDNTFLTDDEIFKIIKNKL